MADPFITPAHLAQMQRQAGLAERKRVASLPTGAIDETLDRKTTATTSITLQVSGRLQIFGTVLLPARQVVTSITVVSGATAMVTPANQWFTLIRVSDAAILGITADDLTTAWGTNAAKTLTLSTPYTATVDTLAFVGAGIVAATMPTVTGVVGSTILTGITPKLAASSNKTGLTNPASFTDAGTISALGTNQGYGYIS